jgi:hypothetical protein
MPRDMQLLFPCAPPSEFAFPLRLPMIEQEERVGPPRVVAMSGIHFDISISYHHIITRPRPKVSIVVFR